jgi:hypothetical protein
MNIDRFTLLLETAFKHTTSVQVHDTQVRRLGKPRPLAPLLDEALEGEDDPDEYTGTFGDWPGNARELLESRGLARSLLTLHWDGFGPVSWSAGLVVIETGGHTYVCKWDELESYQLLAVVRATGNTAGLAQIVVDAIAGGALVQHPPHYIWNLAPRLLDRAVLEDAFAKLLDTNEGWGSLAEEHFGRIVEPNHLRRCLDMLDDLPRHDDQHALDIWLKRVDDDGSDLSEPARRLLLKEFIDRGYEEAA